jgi:hypothetical protein
MRPPTAKSPKGYLWLRLSGAHAKTLYAFILLKCSIHDHNALANVITNHEVCVLWTADLQACWHSIMAVASIKYPMQSWHMRYSLISVRGTLAGTRPFHRSSPAFFSVLILIGIGHGSLGVRDTGKECFSAGPRRDHVHFV